MALTMPMNFSGTSTAVPKVPSSVAASTFCSSETASLAHQPVTDAPTTALMLGMTRMMAACPRRASSHASSLPAATDMNSLPTGGASSASTPSKIWGFTASTTTSLASSTA